MLINDKGQIFSMCRKATTQVETAGLERCRDAFQRVIDMVLDDFPPGVLKKRGFDLPSGKLHGLIKEGETCAMVYVCPVMKSFEPTNGQVIHAIHIANEVPKNAMLTRIDFMVFDLHTGEVITLQLPIQPSGNLMDDISPGEWCNQCQFQGGCQQ